MSIDKIAQSLGIRPLEEALKDQEADESSELIVAEDWIDDDNEVIEGEVVPDNHLASELTKEIQQAQDNMNKLIEQGMAAFKDLVQLSKDSESAKGYEVASNMMEKLINANKDIINVAERKRMSKEESGMIEKPAAVTNNNLIVTTTADILDGLLQNKKAKRKKVEE